MKTNKIYKTCTYIGIVLFVALGIVFITTCVSTGQGKSGDMELVYETDFSDDDGMFVFHDPVERPISEIKNGVLHFNGKSPGGNLSIPYGRDSVTTFRLKLSPEKPNALITVLWSHERGMGHFAILNKDHIYQFTKVKNEDVFSNDSDCNIIPGEWHDISISIRGNNYKMRIDDRLAAEATLDNRLPDKGYLFLLTEESEFWVDDLRIVEETTDTDENLKSKELSFEVKYEEIGWLMKEWEETIRTKDHNRFAQLFLPEATLEFNDRKGRRTDFHGIDAIREFRLDFFKELGPLEEYRLPEPKHYEDHNDVNQSYGFRFKNKAIDEWLHFAKRDETWKIQHLEIVLPVPGSWVTNRYQVIGDKNGDGFLQGDEHGFVYSLFEDFFREPHSATGPLDELFDVDGNGYIDESEIIHTGEILFFRGFRWFSAFQPGWAVHALDLNGNDEITDNELELISGFMIGVEGIKESRNVRNDLDRWMDKSGDGQVSREEIREAKEHFIRLMIQIPCPDALFLPVPRKVSNYLDELADGNGDGRIDKDEHGIIFGSLTHYHDVSNYLERALDLNHDGKMGSNEILLALQASVLGKGIFTTKAEPPYPVVTPMDNFLDPSGDGFVDLGEINSAAAFLAGDGSVADRVSKALRGFTDWNDDGRIEAWEIEEAGTVILYPHPVNRDEPLDKNGDINGDGFIDPDELGISAGVTGKGDAPTLDERIRLVRHQLDARETEKAAADTSAGSDTGTGFQSEYYRRLGKIQDRKLAVISLATETAHVDEETASGIIVFVENAFVNVGKVRVVDRKNIENILSEYKFQSSGLVDENTAIEIGKLSGADIIVMGSINRVGGIFYLNIKLIDVKTAEIIGSNIAQEKDASGFLDMCNQVVYMLF